MFTWVALFVVAGFRVLVAAFEQPNYDKGEFIRTLYLLVASMHVYVYDYSVSVLSSHSGGADLL